MKTRYIITIAAAALVLSGCSRDEIEPGASSDGYLRLEVAGVQTVKGAICNSKDEMLENGVDSFWVEAWKADYTGFVTSQKATYEDSQWSLAVPVQWTGTDAKTFFAHTNLPASGAVVTNTFKSAEQKQKLEYTLPTDARDQNDIMLGYYSGDGKVGGVDAHTAQIQFYHPLTAVKICDGGMCVDSINKVTLSGIYASGTVTVTYPGSTPAYDWGDTRTAFTDATLDPVSPSTGIKVDAKTKVIGVPFIIIPQDVAPGKVRIILDVTIDNASKTLAVDVPATTWQAGHTKSYTLSYGDATGYALAITAWGSDPHDVKLEEDIPELLPGRFSVSAADYVQFSRGNLQYQASTDTWRFAENQYDIIGNAPGNSVTTGRDTQADWIDYFGWGATGLNPYSEKPYSTDYSNSKYKTAATASAGETLTRGNKGDWGVLMGEGWYTLSLGQWTYLLTKRSVNGGTGQGFSYTTGVTYGGKSGLVIYPDDYTGKEITGTVASLPEGVVFLPAASLRNGSGVLNLDNGYYWTSTASGSDYAYRLEFYGSYIRSDWNNASRSDGNSVRLAKKSLKPGILSGEFVINDSGDKVHFSSGNMYSVRSGSEGSYTYTYYFEENQWYYTAPRTPSHNSYFFYSMNASIASDETYSDEGKGNSDVIFTNSFSSKTSPNETFSVNGMTGIWRTLTKDEWVYLTGHNPHVRCTVCNVPGTVIAPAGNDISSMAGQSFTENQWSTYESAGCVFFPTQGYVTTGSTAATDAGTLGQYWTADNGYDDDTKAYAKILSDDNPYSAGTWRNRAIPVRLVTAAE